MSFISTDFKAKMNKSKINKYKINDDNTNMNLMLNMKDISKDTLQMQI